MLWLLTILTANFIFVVNGAEILAIQGTDLKSHFRVISGFLERIAPYHNITYYLDSNLGYKSSENITVHYLPPISITSTVSSSFLNNPCEVDSYSIIYNNILPSHGTFFEKAYKSKSIQDLINSSKKYDILIISGYGSDQFFQIAHIFNATIVQLTPSLMFPWHVNTMNAPYSWADDFSFIIPGNDAGFFNRLNKFMKSSIIFNRFYNVFLDVIDKVTEKYLPPNTPPVLEMIEKTELFFVNTHKVQGYIPSNVPSIIEIGGFHIKPSKKLPDSLENFISDSGEHGFIYFSLGSFIPETKLNKKFVQAVLNVFKRLPQKVLWKWKGEMENLPENILIQNWFPQTDLLAHKKIRLFISQGGMLSTQEAIYHGVPLLILPIVFDQHSNAYLAEKRGYGKTISFCHFTENLFEETVKELLNNSTYKQTIKKMSQYMQYENKNILDKVNWWLNYILTNKDASILRPQTKYDQWKQMPLDIFLFLLIIFLSALIFFLNLIAFIYKYVSENNALRRQKND